MYQQKRLKSNDIDKIYSHAFHVKIDTSLIAPSTRDFLETFAISSSTTLSQLITSILPLVSSLLGPNTGTRLTPSSLTPTNIYLINISAKGGGKTATYQNVLLKGLSSIEKGQKFLLESYTTQGFQVKKFIFNSNLYIK